MLMLDFAKLVYACIKHAMIFRSITHNYSLLKTLKDG